MFTVYFDDSGTPDDHDVVVISGLLSSAEQWGILEREWNETLQTFGIGVPFRMSAFEARKVEPWKNLKKNDRIELIRRLTGIMALRVKSRFYTALVVPEARTLFKPNAEKQYAATLCAFGCASRVSAWAQDYGGGEPVAYIFEGGTRGEGFVFNAFDEVVKKEHPVVGLIGTRTKGDKQRPPLQAADVWAYESRKYLAWQYNNENRPVRRSLDRLLDIPDGQGFVLGGRALVKIAETFQVDGMIADVKATPFSREQLPTFTWSS